MNHGILRIHRNTHVIGGGFRVFRVFRGFEITSAFKMGVK